MKRSGVLLLILGLAAGCSERESTRPAAAPSEPAANAASWAPPAGAAEILSPVFFIKKKYRSMEGPYHVQQVRLVEDPDPQLLWITGYRMAVVGRNGVDEVSQEFLCHNNLSFDAERHAEEFRWSKQGLNRLFTLSQGQFAIELPEGFGIPVMSNEYLELQTQVLNHNLENPDLQVRHRVEIDVVRDDELETKPRPLYSAAAMVMALVEGKDGFFGISEPGKVHEGASCLPGKAAEHAITNPDIPDQFGRTFTGHWIVEPGRETRNTLATEQLDLPFDTTIHFIAVHLHPFAESVELMDLTTGTSVWKANARGPEQGVGLTHVDSFASPEGIPVYKDHEYEIVSVYDNPTDVDHDAMATMFFYLHDKEAEKGLEYLRRRTSWARESRMTETREN